MNFRLMLVFLIISILAGCRNQDCSTVQTVKLGSHPAVTPSPRYDKWWQDRHADILEQLKKDKVEMVFIGDSITMGWFGNGKTIWDEYYGHRNAINLGYGGDRTQNVLWRISNGEISGISPRLVILMIGTNNCLDDTPQQIGEGIIAIVQKLRAELPHTKILVLAIFPRREKPNPERDTNAMASLIASKVADNKMVFYKDINSNFLENDGTMVKGVTTNDFIHLSEKGYKLEAQTLEPIITQLMK